MEKKTAISFRGIQPFHFSMTQVTCVREDSINVHEFHVHPDCEIYINLTGDVSFAVEDAIYPIVPGSVIITKPYEYHHCVYHSDKAHKHIWILFSAEQNEEIFDLFFNRKSGTGNLLVLSPEQLDRVVSLCDRMQKMPPSEFEKHFLFFRLIQYLYDAESPEIADDHCPKGLKFALNYMSQHMQEPISIQQLASLAHVSVNTLERHFLDNLNMTPSKYLKRKRLANAARLLSDGSSVADACEKSGFPDYSNFIALFRQNYGITPLQYRKRHYRG